MGSKEVEVTCPCCKSRLAVDVRTEKVVRCQRPEERDAAGRSVVREEDWESALGKVEGRLGTGEDRFDASLKREQDREKDLDRLFEDLKKRTDDQGEPD